MCKSLNICKYITVTINLISTNHFKGIENNIHSSNFLFRDWKPQVSKVLHYLISCVFCYKSQYSIDWSHRKRGFSNISPLGFHIEEKPHISYIPVFLQTQLAKETSGLPLGEKLGLSSPATMACACVIG